MTVPQSVPKVAKGYSGSDGQGGGFWAALAHDHVPELRWPYSVSAYDRIRKDAQAASALLACKLPILRTGWRIDPNGARPEVYEPLAYDLGLPVAGAAPTAQRRTRDRFSWSDHLRLALLKLDFGHAVFEQEYRYDEASGLHRLRKLGPRLPKTIEEWKVDRDGGLISVKQFGAQAMKVDSLVVYCHDREGGAWWGQSILRPVWKPWFLKDPVLKTWVQSLDRNGVGVPVYTAAEADEDLSKGLAIATSIRAGDSAGAAIPEGAALAILGVQGQLTDPEKAVRYFDEQMLSAVLAHFLKLGTQTGSWALGSTFADFFINSLQDLAQGIADTATQHIVEDWVDINFGPDEPAPRIVFDEIGSQKHATAQALKMLVDAGLIFPDRVLEEAIRQEHGLPAKATPTPAAAGLSPLVDQGWAPSL